MSLIFLVFCRFRFLDFNRIHLLGRGVHVLMVGGFGSEPGGVVYQADAICSSHLQRFQANQHCHFSWSLNEKNSFFAFSPLYFDLNIPVSYPCSYHVFFLTDQNTQAFKEVAIIRHPRVGEYAFGFITSTVVLQVSTRDFVYCSLNCF